MALSSSWRDLSPRDSPPADSSAPISQGGSGNGARADVARKTKEVEHMLANLEKEGVEIDDKIASIIYDEVAKIKGEAVRENIKGQKRSLRPLPLPYIISCIALGFIMGAECCEQAIKDAMTKKLRSG